MSIREEALALHRDKRGKLEMREKVRIHDAYDLALAYSPGVAEPCLEIQKDNNLAYMYTNKANLVAVVSNGTAVLGLGSIGALASMPVMEGKAVLFKTFAGVDAFPICIDTADVEQVIQTIRLLEPMFGGINLEDISAPACFEIEERLKKEMNIPVFHDDQHGTAIVVLAGLINALKVVEKPITGIRVVMNGAGAAGAAIVKLLIKVGVRNIIVCDTHGTIYRGRSEGMNKAKNDLAEITNSAGVSGSLADAMHGADVFIGVSAANTVNREMVKAMADEPIIFALANPNPEIMPELAKEAGARVVGTGRSDKPNQINNVLAFPGIFRGALDVRASQINEEMKIAAAYAIAELVSAAECRADYIIPQVFDPRVAPAVAAAVAQAAIQSGAARVSVDPKEISKKVWAIRSN